MPGVSVKSSGYIQAYIMVNGRMFFLGSYGQNDLELAERAAFQARIMVYQAITMQHYKDVMGAPWAIKNTEFLKEFSGDE